MPRNFLARAVLAAALGCGVWAGLARAGEPGYYPKTPPQATELPPGYPPVDSTPSQHPVWDRVHTGRPIGCWASFNGYGCSSLHSTLGFIFGSCRTFFSEPCLKGAPPSIAPPWAGPETGYYGPAPGARPPAGRFPGGPPAGPAGGGCACP